MAATTVGSTVVAIAKLDGPNAPRLPEEVERNVKRLFNIALTLGQLLVVWSKLTPVSFPRQLLVTRFATGL